MQSLPTWALPSLMADVHEVARGGAWRWSTRRWIEILKGGGKVEVRTVRSTQLGTLTTSGELELGKDTFNSQ